MRLKGSPVSQSTALMRGWTVSESTGERLSCRVGLFQSEVRVDRMGEEGFQLAGKENYSKVVINKPLCVPLLAQWDQRWKQVITPVICS